MMPTENELVWYYPPGAVVLAIDGRVTIRCRVKVDGSTTDCRITKEDPPGYGFGLAGLAAAARFKFKPQTVDGKATDRGEVVIPIHFPKAGGPHELEFARRCAGWAQATEEAMAQPDSELPAWAYVFWRFRYTASAVATGTKPSEITKTVESYAKWAALRRTDNALYGGCLNGALVSWPKQPFR
jgi:TonB family protein